MIQESIKKGILVTWTKSFACPDGVGMDAVKLLEDSLAKHAVCCKILLYSSTHIWISAISLLAQQINVCDISFSESSKLHVTCISETLD